MTVSNITEKTALITGITGQDGAYLTALLLEEGYTVYGTYYRRTSSVNFWRLDEMGVLQHPSLHLVEYDLMNMGAANRIVNPKIRFYRAGTSEMFGKVQAIPQGESAPFYHRYGSESRRDQLGDIMAFPLG